MVSANVAVAGTHIPLSATVSVSVIRPPVFLSFVPKLYVGVRVVPLVNVPSPFVLHRIVPFADVYPAGMV